MQFTFLVSKADYPISSSYLNKSSVDLVHSPISIVVFFPVLLFFFIVLLMYASLPSCALASYWCILIAGLNMYAYGLPYIC